MKRLARKAIVLASTIVFAMLVTGLALAKPASGGYELFGNALLVSPGNASPTAAQIQSTGVYPAPTSFGGIDFSVPEGITFEDLTRLSNDYMITSGDCGLGSPRYQINVIDPDDNQVKNIFVYLGPYPNYTQCQQNVWVNTGDLLQAGNFIDTSQIGGTFYHSYEDAVAAFGDYVVTGIQLVVDNSNITAVIDNVMINNNLITFETANSCKNGGYTQFTSAPGPFKNQGQCVSYFANGGK